MSSEPLVPFDAGKPSSARIYDYALGGKNNFAADRELVARMQEIFPLGAMLVRENRQFLARAVEHVSRQASASSSTWARACRPARPRARWRGAS